jgi:RimJ/RimL family protein N-acetyltransferase
VSRDHSGVTATIEIGILAGNRVRLEPLGIEHVDALLEAADEDRSTYRFTTVPATRDAMTRYVEDVVAARARGEAFGFAQVRVTDDRVAGATRFLHLRAGPGVGAPYAVEIGATWLAASAQRSGINTEAKLLLLAHAFDVWDVGRVDFKTDARNEQSRTALAAIGATFEGVLRSWQPSHADGEDGRLRDSALFSIVASEWPAVRRLLEGRLERPGERV